MDMFYLVRVVHRSNGVHRSSHCWGPQHFVYYRAPDVLDLVTASNADVSEVDWLTY